MKEVSVVFKTRLIKNFLFRLYRLDILNKTNPFPSFSVVFNLSKEMHDV